MTYFSSTTTAVFLLYWTAAAFGADTPAPSQDTSGITLSNPLASQPLELLSAIVDRPLFSPSRRPPAAPVSRTAEPTAPASPPDLVVSGIVMDGTSARAVVRVGTEKKIFHAHVGDNIDGWTVSQIEGRKLVLSLGDRFATYTLFPKAGE